MKTVVIIGGGLAGLIASIKLIKAGISCTVIEKKTFPFHRVCGEYISNEVAPFLKSEGLYPEKFNPPQINTFMLSSIEGKSATMKLDLGGFGISRYLYDNYLFKEAQKLGVEFLLNTEAIDVVYHDEQFTIHTQVKVLSASLVIGAFGKRSKLDHQLNRTFIKNRSPYVGIKYHIKYAHPANLIALHNFRGGYCGINTIEDDKTNLCYLTHRDNLKAFRNVREMEEAILFKNPLLKSILTNCDFIFNKPETTNEISFEEKECVVDHVLMIGDAAGMITPLCGNGMAMAIHSSKIIADLLIRFFNQKDLSRLQLEEQYTILWKKHFKWRLWTGRQVQKFFGSVQASNAAIHLALLSRPLANFIIRNTHGKTF